MSRTAAKKNLWGNVLFVTGGIAVIAAIVRLFSRCGVTC